MSGLLSYLGMLTGTETAQRLRDSVLEERHNYTVVVVCVKGGGGCQKSTKELFNVFQI